MRLLIAYAVLLQVAYSAIADQIALHTSDYRLVNDVASTLKETSLLKLHRELVQIDSVTGLEEDVGEYLVKYLKALNYTVDKQAVKSSTSRKPRFNIHAYPGQRHTRALFTSHMDTVPPFLNYSVHKSGQDVSKTSTEIWGRGTNDDKSCVAAQIIALNSLLGSGKIKPSDAGLLFVVGEEKGGDGMHRANDLGLAWETVIFGEPTEGKLVAGHKGFLAFEIKAKGKAVHSGYPWLGQSANEILLAALSGLQRLTSLEENEGGLPTSEKYGRSTLNIGRIEGGVAPNVVAETAEASIAIRLAGGTPREVRKLCLQAIEEATRDLLKDGLGSVKVDMLGESYGPVAMDTDIDGFETVVVNYGTDVPNLDGVHKRYLYGPGSILTAHSDHEHLTVEGLERAVEDFKKILLEVLKK